MTRYPDPDLTVDARGLRCPLPVLRARKRLQDLAAGAVLCLRADDPMALIDLPHFCAGAGHDYLGHEEGPDGLRLYLRKTRAD
ncbi:sulfurtransferase TusA family protein [Mangrovicoccus algicola]|uniref:Sulfurtransferase TusA family protein n=1 Tax=Mangrovicoccus algicola TaxID=2771008 RepID=A0A8J6YWU2_9RHOB|nr:sulfurtransferase TusA family protein [Mangrovicoccus algicola]MBE3639067.1 sulfurtransferase TusA family protein [Mangrovicoccus algicola]